MIIAFTGAGISKASGIPTFNEMGDLREKLDREFANTNPKEFKKIIDYMTDVCSKAKPNDAHLALAQYNIPVITMNIDGLHQKAKTKHVLPIHGNLPDSVVLYGDPAPNYETAHNWVFQLRPGDIFLIIGTSYYTTIATQLKFSALSTGADVIEINEDAEHEVRKTLQRYFSVIGDFNEFMRREPIF